MACFWTVICDLWFLSSERHVKTIHTNAINIYKFNHIKCAQAAGWETKSLQAWKWEFAGLKVQLCRLETPKAEKRLGKGQNGLKSIMWNYFTKFNSKYLLESKFIIIFAPQLQRRSGKTQCGRRRPDVVRCKGFNIMKNKKGTNKWMSRFH